ncbi:MAG TPA: JAB domain-containing protein [Rhodospirillales bacterium]|nr:JAB domain-containing protein [Rhodospirillales bacterium]
MNGKPEKKEPHYTRHRQRLRERFMKGGADVLPDYELLELLLFSAIPRRDVKPLAKALIDKFGTFSAVISAEPEELAEVKGMGEIAVIALKMVRAAALRFKLEELKQKEFVGNWQALMDYCYANLAYGKIEQFRILYLNPKNYIIADEAQQKGTVDHTPVYPREVVKRALELGATAIIMVHNHPSGDMTPSTADIEMTRKVKEAGKNLGITLHDHIIVAKGGTFSFKNKNLL